MYHRVRRKMKYLTYSAILILSHISLAIPKSIQSTENTPSTAVDNIDNNIIDFDEEYSVKFNNRYGHVPWDTNDKFNKESHRYTFVKDNSNREDETVTLSDDQHNETNTKSSLRESTETTTDEYSVIPLELISTTENVLVSIVESTTEPDYSVIPLSTTVKDLPIIKINQTVTLPTSTEATEDFSLGELETTSVAESTTPKTSKVEVTTTELNETIEINKNETITTEIFNTSVIPLPTKKLNEEVNTTVIPIITEKAIEKTNVTKEINNPEIPKEGNTTVMPIKETTKEVLNTNSTSKIETVTETETDFGSPELEVDVPVFTELDAEDDKEVPEDYYDAKDVVPTTAPKTDALSVLVGLAGSMVESVVESVAERVVPKGIFDLFKRMQKQNEALEAERLRSREENGGLGKN